MVVSLLLLGVVIGSNNLAVCLALGALGEARRRLRIVATFGVFEFLMPLAGLHIGYRAAETVAHHADWIAPSLLILLGASSVIGPFTRVIDEEALADRATSRAGLAMLAAGLSLDNLLVGLSMGLLAAPALAVAATVSVFSMAFSWLGLTFGHRVRRRGRIAAEVGAGLLLVVLGVGAVLGLFGPG